MYPARILSALLLLWPPSALVLAADWQAQAVQRAVEYHLAHLPEACDRPSDTLQTPTHFELQIGEDTAARQALLVEFACRSGAYNHSAVYLMSDQHGRVTEVFFPSPQIEVRHAEGSEQRVVEDIAIVATPELREVVNPRYDAASRSMFERNKWRGLGDAYTATQWGYKQGRFQIMRFAVDASFDGQDNPRTLIEQDIW